VSLRPLRNAAALRALASADPSRINPTTGIADCCARAASGQTAAAPPRSVMNSRRLMSDIGLSPAWPCRSVYRTLTLPQRGGQVLGAGLNCSESRHCRHTMRQEAAALRDFNQAHVRFGSWLCENARGYVIRAV